MCKQEHGETTAALAPAIMEPIRRALEEDCLLGASSQAGRLGDARVRVSMLVGGQPLMQANRMGKIRLGVLQTNDITTNGAH